MKRVLVAAAGLCSIGLPVAATLQVGKPLPGSTGPRVEFLERKPAGVELVDVAVESDDAAKTTEPVQTLPSGTKRFRFVIKTKGLPPQGTQFSVDIVNRAGPVKREGYSSFVQVVNRAGTEATFSLAPPGGDPYPDGPYRATVSIGDVKVAVLNWSIGTP